MVEMHMEENEKWQHSNDDDDDDDNDDDGNARFKAMHPPKTVFKIMYKFLLLLSLFLVRY